MLDGVHSTFPAPSYDAACFFISPGRPLGQEESVISSNMKNALRHLYEHSEESDPLDCGTCREVVALVLEGYEAKLQRLVHRHREANAPIRSSSTVMDYSTRVRDRDREWPGHPRAG